MLICEIHIQDILPGGILARGSVDRFFLRITLDCAPGFRTIVGLPIKHTVPVHIGVNPAFFCKARDRDGGG